VTFQGLCWPSSETKPMDRLQRSSTFAGLGSRSEPRGAKPLAGSRAEPSRFLGFMLDHNVGLALSGGMSIIMHDLAGADPQLRFSPYCWRTRFALAHKGLPVETIPWRFTEKEAIAFSGQARVPVIRDGDQVVFDSWSIAEYLEDTYPTLPIFNGPGGRAHALFINSWADAVLLGGIARFIVRDLLDVIDPKDQSYFRTSREARFSMSLEAVQAGRDDRVAAFRDTLMPIRLVLRRQKWLGGATPGYADHIIAGTLMWPRCASRFALLASDDPVAEWFGRMLDQYGGLGRNAKTP
jgi:glutathione S-transferase